MDQRESHIRQDIEETHTVITEKIESIENRVHETMEGTKSTIDNVMNNVKRVQETVEDAKVTIDNVLDTIKRTMDETVERVNYAADLIDQVNQNPWIMFGSAVLMGYILSSVNREGALGSRQAHELRREHAAPEHPTAPRSSSL